MKEIRVVYFLKSLENGFKPRRKNIIQVKQYSKRIIIFFEKTKLNEQSSSTLLACLKSYLPFLNIVP